MKDANEASADSTRFELFYDTHTDALYRSVFFRTGSSETASDIVQESYVRVWQRWSSYESDDHRVRALYTIARNLVMDHYRKQQKIAGEPDTATLTATEDLPDEHHHKQRAVEQLMTLLQQLTPTDRDIVIARSLDSTPYNEIALTHNKNEATIRKIHSRALQKLAQLFRNTYGINYRPY